MRTLSKLVIAVGLLLTSGLSFSATVVVDEFYAPSVNDFFLTWWPPEIDALDSGRLGSWQLLHSFVAFDSPPDAQATPVCRFWTGHSHFFSASPDECAAVYANYPEFTLETWAAFYVYLPDGSGQCFTGEIPVYRLWDGASDSHFYTTSLDERDYLVANGWTSEGWGPDGVSMCSPSP